MAEQQTIDIAAGKADLGLRCMLLTAVMEGRTLDTDEVSSFVHRLSAFDGDDHPFEAFLG